MAQVQHSKKTKLPDLGERLIPPGCTRPFWVLPAEGSRVVDKNHPGALKISCGKCERCALTRLSMQVGRAAAQAHISSRTLLVTLTYAPIPDPEISGQTIDPPGATALDVEHARLFRKTMKNRYDFPGSKISYLIAGEYGTRRGRAHWHALLMFPKDAPERGKLPSWADLPEWVERDHVRANRASIFTSCGVEVKADWTGAGYKYRATIPEWPHGHVDIKTPDIGGIRYVAKYILSDQHRSMVDRHRSASSIQTAFIRSRNLGTDYVMEHAKDNARKGAVPRNGTYTVPGAVARRGPKKGKSLSFTMTHTMRRKYCEQYVDELTGEILSGRKLNFAPDYQKKMVDGKIVLIPDMITSYLEKLARDDPERIMRELVERLINARKNALFTLNERIPAAKKVETLPDGGLLETDAGGVLRLVYRHVDGGNPAFAQIIDDAGVADEIRQHGGYVAIPGAVVPDYSFRNYADRRAALRVDVRSEVGPMIQRPDDPFPRPSYVVHRTPLYVPKRDHRAEREQAIAGVVAKLGLSSGPASKSTFPMVIRSGSGPAHGLSPYWDEVVHARTGFSPKFAAEDAKPPAPPDLPSAETGHGTQDGGADTRPQSWPKAKLFCKECDGTGFADMGMGGDEFCRTCSDDLRLLYNRLSTARQDSLTDLERFRRDLAANISWASSKLRRTLTSEEIGHIETATLNRVERYAEAPLGFCALPPGLSRYYENEPGRPATKTEAKKKAERLKTEASKQYWAEYYKSYESNQIKDRPKEKAKPPTKPA